MYLLYSCAPEYRQRRETDATAKMFINESLKLAANVDGSIWWDKVCSDGSKSGTGRNRPLTDITGGRQLQEADFLNSRINIESG